MNNAYLTLPSPFPVEHRLIYTWPILRWPKTGADIEPLGPALAEAINLILALHQNRRGLIHSVSYPRTKLLVRHCLSERLFEHDRTEPFDHAIMRLARTPGAVLVSPRALEGVDLRGDHSEFQIFLKIPFKSLGDDRVKARTNADRDWYALQAATDLVQGSGRSVRTMDDAAPTYILDAAWAWWYPPRRNLFPPYFRDALRDFVPPQPLTAA